MKSNISHEIDMQTLGFIIWFSSNKGLKWTNTHLSSHSTDQRQEDAASSNFLENSLLFPNPLINIQETEFINNLHPQMWSQLAADNLSLAFSFLVPKKILLKEMFILNINDKLERTMD